MSKSKILNIVSSIRISFQEGEITKEKHDIIMYQCYKQMEEIKNEN